MQSNRKYVENYADVSNGARNKVMLYSAKMSGNI